MSPFTVLRLSKLSTVVDAFASSVMIVPPVVVAKPPDPSVEVASSNCMGIDNNPASVSGDSALAVSSVPASSELVGVVSLLDGGGSVFSVVTVSVVGGGSKGASCAKTKRPAGAKTNAAAKIKINRSAERMWVLKN